MLARTQRLFQLSLITVFATVLFMGTAGVNTALAVHQELEGKLVIKETCHDGTNKPIKRTIKSNFYLLIDPSVTNLQGTDACGTACLLPYPSWAYVELDIDDFDGPSALESFFKGIPSSALEVAGIALTKNIKKGTFQTFADNDADNAVVGNRVLSLSGSLVADKKNGDTLKIVGKITGYDTTANCTYVGKFKGKKIIPN